jgi:hypothetical protein
LLEIFVGIASLLAAGRQQGQQRLMYEHAAVVPERSNEFPENHRLTKRIFSGVVRRRDRWLTDEGEPVVETSFDLAE